MMDEKINDVDEMPVFRCFYGLAVRVEKETRHFGPDFRWLRGQLLRSSESVPANMTEGFYAQYSTEYLQSLYRCRREARETMTHLRYARDVGVMTCDIVSEFSHAYEDALRQLASLIRSIDRKILTYGRGKADVLSLSELADTDYEVNAEM